MKNILLILALFSIFKILPIDGTHISYRQKRSPSGFQGGLNFGVFPFAPQIPGLFPPPFFPPFPPSFPPPFPPQFAAPFPPSFGLPYPYPPPYGYPAPIPAPTPVNPAPTGVSGFLQSFLGSKLAAIAPPLPPPPPPPIPFPAYPYPVASPVPVPFPVKVPVPIHVLKTVHVPASHYTPVEPQHQDHVSQGHVSQSQFETDQIEPWNSSSNY